MDLATIIETAKRRSAVLPPPDTTVVQIRLDGQPSHLMTNAVAAFQGELEDLFLRQTQIVSGGSGCLLVEFAIAQMDPAMRERITAFFKVPENLAYFRRRYGINAVEVRHTRQRF